jgi:hypothetical protein
MTINEVIERTVACVTRDDHEVQWFHNEKDAAAFVQHVYGLTPYDLIGHESVAIKSFCDREPRAGDLIKTPHGVAVISGDGEAVLNARTFRAGERVSCSGGPCVTYHADRLRFVGLETVRCWRWADGYPAAHNGGDYTVTVPVWKEEK